MINLAGFAGSRRVLLVGCEEEVKAAVQSELNNHPLGGRFDLVIENSAHSQFPGCGSVIYPRDLSESSEVVVVEDVPSAIPIARNLAAKRGCALVVIPPIPAEKEETFVRNMHALDEGGVVGDDALQACKAIVEGSLGLEFCERKLAGAAFVSRIPLNLYPFPFPTGHILLHNAGMLTTASLVKHLIPTGTAIVLDSAKTQSTGPSEFAQLKPLLRRNGYGILPREPAGGLAEFKHYVEDVPADVMFLAAHCGFIDLPEYSVTLTVGSATHELRVAIHRSVYGLPQGGAVTLESTYIPISVDGVPWKNGEDRRSIFAAFTHNEQEESLRGERKMFKIEPPVLHQLPMKCLECGDEQYFGPLTHTFGADHLPLVFNNSCGSYIGLCNEFLPDVSFYIGTAKMVDSFSAPEVSKQFVANLKPSVSVGDALFQAQRQFIRRYTPYLLAGVPWASLPGYGSEAIAVHQASMRLKATAASLPPPQKPVDLARFRFLKKCNTDLFKQLFDKNPP